jgi:hypothetical protein
MKFFLATGSEKRTLIDKVLVVNHQVQPMWPSILESRDPKVVEAVFPTLWRSVDTQKLCIELDVCESAQRNFWSIFVTTSIRMNLFQAAISG